MSDLARLGHGVHDADRLRNHVDLRSTSHAVTCDYLVGRGFRVCTCHGSRTRSAGPRRH